MRLGRRLLFSFYMVALVASAGAVASVYLLLMPNFFVLEEDAVRKDVDRVERAFMQMMTTLHARTIDWAQRPEISMLMSAPSETGLVNLPEVSSGAMRVDQIIVFGEEGQHQTPRDALSGFDAQVVELVYEEFRERACYSYWGLRSVAGVPVMFAIEPLGECGALFFGVALDEKLAWELSGITDMPVAFGDAPEADFPPDDILINRLSDREIEGIFAIRDFTGQPVATGIVRQSRPVNDRAGRALLSLAAAIIAVAFLAVTVVHFRIRSLVFRRLISLHQIMRQLSVTRDLRLRARVEGDDEIAELASDFNTMVAGMVVAHREIEESQHQAEEASQAKSRFLANMSHEIRTPMTAILGYTELLRDKRISDRERAHYLDIIQQNGDALLVLINEVLDLSRIEAGQMTMEEREFSLPDLLDDVLQTHGLRASEKGIDVSLRYVTPVPQRLVSDPFRLRQILVNLIGNAIKFTDEGEIVMEVSWRPELITPLQVVVSDTGIGIAPEHMDTVFEPFRQVDGTDTRKHGGSGLGLAIARQLARSLGGDIRVSSKRREGSRFALEIVAEAVSDKLEIPHAPEYHEHEEKPVALHGVALVVEDNDVNRMFVVRVLERAGMEVVQASQGEEALSLLVGGLQPDLVVMDMQMPVMDGFTAVEHLRQFGFQGPILALTANVLHEDRARCLAAGCDEFLTKPVRVKQLLETCHQLLCEKAGQTRKPETLESGPDTV